MPTDFGGPRAGAGASRRTLDANVRSLKWVKAISLGVISAHLLCATTEVSEPHSITSSARASKVGDTVRPSALAVRRLMTN